MNLRFPFRCQNVSRGTFIYCWLSGIEQSFTAPTVPHCCRRVHQYQSVFEFPSDLSEYS